MPGAHDGAGHGNAKLRESPISRSSRRRSRYLVPARVLVYPLVVANCNLPLHVVPGNLVLNFRETLESTGNAETAQPSGIPTAPAEAPLPPPRVATASSSTRIWSGSQAIYQIVGGYRRASSGWVIDWLPLFGRWSTLPRSSCSGPDPLSVDTRFVNEFNLFILKVLKAWTDPAQKHPKTIHHHGYGRFAVDGKMIKLKSRKP